MQEYVLDQLVENTDFDEKRYLGDNPDVAKAVREGWMSSGKSHFDSFGKNENRKYRVLPDNFLEIKAAKRERIRGLLRSDMQCQETSGTLDFLTPEMRKMFELEPNDAVSSHPYDQNLLEELRKNKDSIALDCGCGRRPVYYSNVVNYEIMNYDTTDVVGAGEVLPFKDNSFDVVISIAVLEHVKDPFVCAAELLRVLKPGGYLYCAVPFLQPYHAHPNHFYNMTHQGLRNLFKAPLSDIRVEVIPAFLPVHTLWEIISRWSQALNGSARNEFLDMKISDFLENPYKMHDLSIVKELPSEICQQLSSGNLLTARKI